MNSSIRRHAIGVVALALLVSSVVLLLQYDENVGQVAGTTCLRVGLTLAALWLAFPQVLTIASKYPPRLLAAILIGGLVVIIRPRSFPLVLLLVAAVGVMEVAGRFLRPPSRKSGRTSSRRK
jgi:hypothetical protein